MKKIIVLFALLLGSIISIAQPVTQRGTSAVTVQDSRLFAELNFRPPAFPDTVRANQQIGLDSCGALIFSRDINAYYYRACSPKRWVRVASGGSTSDSAYLSYRPLTDSTFLLCRVGGTRCDTIKVNGKGVTQAWLLGGNLNPVSNNLGTTSTTDVVIITNDVARMKIAGNGINRSSAARNRYLMIDTLTRYLFYGDESDTTAWKLLGNSNAIAGTSFLGTTNNVPLEFRIKNKKSGIIDSTNKNVGLGFNTLKTNAPNGVILPPPNNATLGTYNVAIGHNALSKDTLGYQNVAIGGGALGTTTTYSQRNVAIGYAALNQSITPSLDVAIGWGALARDYYGQANTAVGADVANFYAPASGDTMAFNTLVGYSSAKQKKAGKYNVFVGDSTGALNINGSSNVFIGSRAGQNETGSSKLYISNSSTSNPLIKGNFADSTLNVNGKMSISLTSQTPDSSLDVTGGVKLRTIYRSGALTDSMLLVGADGGVVKREVIVPSNTNVTRIISGSAVWDSLLVYSVTKCFYYINGILYNSPATNITLAAADSSNPRIDVIYCDTLGNVGVITGIPSPNPVKPTVNPLSQIELTHININAQATTPVGVSNRIIYNENVGVPNEWNTSKSLPLSPADFAYTINPYVGTKSAYAPPFEGNYSLIFTNNAFVNADTLSELSMYLRQNSAPPAKVGTNMFSVILYKSGVKVTNQVFVSDGFYGYSLLTLNSYQHIAIPFSSFVYSNPLDKTFDQIQILLDFSTIPKLGFQFDYITAGAGGTPPAVISNYWSLTGNDNTSFPNAKLGTTSKDKLSIVTSDVERINIANTGVISLPQLQTTTDTLLYKPLVINPSNGQVAGITNWGNNTVYTENPIMSRTSGDSNIIYFNADTANAWRGGGGTTPNLQQVTDVGDTTTNNIFLNKMYMYDGTNDIYSLNARVEDENFYITSGASGADYFRVTDGEMAIYKAPSSVGVIRAYNLTGGRAYDLPDASGTLLLDAPSDGNLYGRKDNAWEVVSGGGGTGTVTSISQGYGITNSPNPIVATGTIKVDTSTGGLSGKYLRLTDTSTMLSPYLRKIDTASLSNRINLKVNISDTSAMLSPYLRKIDTASLSNRINLKVNISDTSAMLSPYLRKIDTTNRFVNNVTKKNDSTITVFKGSTSTDIVLPRGSTGSSGTVTSIAQGYGIANSPNPIIATGTVTVDTSTSGLSGKYLRIVDTANKWVSGSGTATRVPYWSASRTLTSSPNMIWNTPDSSLGVSNFYTGTAGSTQFDINSTATSLPLSLGIWRRQINGAYTYFKEDEQGAQHKWAFVRRDGFNQTRDFYQVNSSIMNINLGWGNPNSSNYDGSTLLINPNINITNALNTGTIIRGIYYNPTLTSLTNTKHIAFESTSGDVVMKGLKKSSSTTDSIAIFINDTLSKAPYPASATGFVPYTGATSNLDMGAKNITANAYFNGFTSMIAAGTTVTLTIDSTPVHNVTGSGGQTYQLPNATTLTNGTIFSFNNNQSSGNISVNNNSGTLVKAVGSGGYMTLELTNNTTAAGTWDSHFQTPSNVSWSTNTFDYGGSITSAQWNGTTVAYNRGGTGQSSLFTQGGVAFGSTTTALGTTAAGTSGQVLTSAGTGTPTWSTVITPSDTSVFQRKSISSYTMLANNTNASGNATAQTFRDTAGTYAGTITWTGTAPTTQTINKYQWQQTGKMVRLQLFGYYTNAAVASTSVTLTIPADCPAPDISMFTSGSLAILYQGIGGLGLSNTSLTTTTNAYMRRNVADNGNELIISAAGANYRRYQIDITYRAQ